MAVPKTTPPEVRPAKRRRRTKNRHRTDPIGGSPMATASASVAGGSISDDDGPRDKKPRCLSREADGPKSSVITETGSSKTVIHSNNSHKLQLELRSARNLAQELRGELDQTQTSFKTRIADLEKQLRDKTDEADRHRAELETTQKLLSDRSTHSESVQDALHCGVCFEPLSDPHLLACGHTACRACLLQWFRSANAYPAQDILEVNEEDDMRYRTKVCHLCREPVLRRPVRMFALQDIVDIFYPGKNTNDETLVSRDPWDLTFPPEPTSYLMIDAADGVERCPACGVEVYDGECVSCGLTFSFAGGSDVESNGAFVDRLLDGDISDEPLTDSDEERGRVRAAIRRRLPLPPFIDNEAEEAIDPDFDSFLEDDDNLAHDEGATEDEEHVNNINQVLRDFERARREVLDREDAEGRVNRRRAAAAPLARPPRMYDLNDEDEDGDDGYESSFIDDDADSMDSALDRRPRRVRRGSVGMLLSDDASIAETDGAEAVAGAGHVEPALWDDDDELSEGHIPGRRRDALRRAVYGDLSYSDSEEEMYLEPDRRPARRAGRVTAPSLSPSPTPPPTPRHRPARRHSPPGPSRQQRHRTRIITVSSEED